MALVLLPPLGVPAGALAPLVAPLSPHAPLLLHDLPGQGLAAPSEATSLEQVAQWVVDGLDAMDVGRFDLCGFGFGGIVALRLALDHGARVDRLIVACASAAPGNSDAYLARARLVRDEGLQGIAQRIVRAWVTPAGLARRPALEHRLAALLTTCDAPLYARHCEMLSAVDLGDSLHQLSQPTLVIAATEDQGLPPAHSRRLAAAIPDATLREIDAAAHLPWLEQPDAVAGAIVAHLAPAVDAVEEFAR
jgi:3-oxoadipate enol-lactonase / 4-carboxymuconolactone decarboxylase